VADPESRVRRVRTPAVPGRARGQIAERRARRTAVRHVARVTGADRTQLPAAQVFRHGALDLVCHVFDVHAHGTRGDRLQDGLGRHPPQRRGIRRALHAVRRPIGIRGAMTVCATLIDEANHA